MGKRMSIPVALAFLRSTEPALRKLARDYLGNRGDARAVTALVGALNDADDDVRFEVVWLLGGLEARYDLLLEHLKNDPSAAVRHRCLRGIWPDNPRAPEAYRAALDDSDERVLVEACIKVGLMRRSIPGAWRDEIVRALRRLLEHSSWRICYEACESLYKIGAVDQQVVSALEELDGHPGAVKFNEETLSLRRVHPARSNFPPWCYTTDELLQAARDALNGRT